MDDDYNLSAEADAWGFKASEFDSSWILPLPYWEEHCDCPQTGQHNKCYLWVSHLHVSYVWPEDNLEHKSQDQVKWEL